MKIIITVGKDGSQDFQFENFHPLPGYVFNKVITNFQKAFKRKMRDIRIEQRLQEAAAARKAAEEENTKQEDNEVTDDV